MAAAVASALLLPALTGPSRTAQLKAGLSPLYRCCGEFKRRLSADSVLCKVTRSVKVKAKCKSALSKTWLQAAL